MKSYELVQLTPLISTIKATEEEKTFWIPTDPANSDYAEYLRYTEWVEAGNNPEEFWNNNTEVM